MISAVILAKNEEKRILDCIESVKWCSEILVIDDESTDNTVEIAKKTGANVISHPLSGNFSDSRNFCLEKAKNEWVLFVDVDERVSEKLKEEIKHAIVNDGYDGYRVQRVDHIWGKKLRYGEVGNTCFVRLGKKKSGKWKGAVHEEWDIQGNIGKLKNELLHYPFENYSEFLTKINFYTTLRAKELFEQKVRSGFLTIVLYTKGKFHYNYFYKLGVLDGTAGFVHAITMSFHSFLVRSKLWLLWNKNK